jgi:hypothetical protein
MKLRVEVKQQHIDKGRRRRSESCPIALAVRDAGYRDVKVGLNLSFGKRGTPGRKILRLPLQASVWIHNFDNGKPVKPFVFVAREML